LCISVLNRSLWACGQSEYFADFLGDINTRNVTGVGTSYFAFLCDLLPTEGRRSRYLKAGVFKRIFGFKTEEVM
jgi:hypothetical protein